MPCCSCTWSNCCCNYCCCSLCSKTNIYRSKQKRMVAFESRKISQTRIDNTSSPIARTLSQREDNSIPVISITAATAATTAITATLTTTTTTATATIATPATTASRTEATQAAGNTQINWEPPFAEFSTGLMSSLTIPIAAPKSPEMTRVSHHIQNHYHHNKVSSRKANHSNENISSDSPVSTVNMLTTKLNSSSSLNTLSQTALASQECITKPNYRDSHSNSTTPRLLSTSTPTYSSIASGSMIGKSVHTTQSNAAAEKRKFNFSPTLTYTAPIVVDLNTEQANSNTHPKMTVTLPNTADQIPEDPDERASIALQSPNMEHRKLRLMSEKLKTEGSPRIQNDLALLSLQVANIKSRIDLADSQIQTGNASENAACSPIDLFTKQSLPSHSEAHPVIAVAQGCTTARAVVNRSSGSFNSGPFVNRETSNSEPRKSPKRSTVVIFSANTQSSSPATMGNKSPIKRGTAAQGTTAPPPLQLADKAADNASVSIDIKL